MRNARTTTQFFLHFHFSHIDAITASVAKVNTICMNNGFASKVELKKDALE
jgi:hypothetical protein